MPAACGSSSFSRAASIRLALHAVGLAALVDLHRVRQFGCVDGDDHLAAEVERNALLPAELLHRQFALAAVGRPERAGLVVDAGVQHAGVVAGLVVGDFAFLFEEQQLVPGNRSSSRYAVASPTIPPPTMATSVVCMGRARCSVIEGEVSDRTAVQGQYTLRRPPCPCRALRETSQGWQSLGVRGYQCSMGPLGTFTRAVAMDEWRSPWRADLVDEMVKRVDRLEQSQALLQIFRDAELRPIPRRKFSELKATPITMLVGHAASEMPNEKVNLFSWSWFSRDSTGFNIGQFAEQPRVEQGTATNRDRGTPGDAPHVKCVFHRTDIAVADDRYF